MVYAAGHSPESLRNELMRRAAGVSFSFRKQPSEEFFSRSFYILTKKHVNARAREGVADSRVIKVHKTSSERMEVLCGRRLCRDDVRNPTRCHKPGFDVFRGLPPFLPQKPPALPAGAKASRLQGTLRPGPTGTGPCEPGTHSPLRNPNGSPPRSKTVPGAGLGSRPECPQHCKRERESASTSSRPTGGFQSSVRNPDTTRDARTV